MATEWKTLIIDLLSDTHNRHAQFECAGGDILLHAGDVSGMGTDEQILNFINWFAKQPYKHRVFIPGNHDFALERNFEYWKKECLNRDVHVLNDSGVVLTSPTDPELNLKIWGSPVQPEFCSWAFNRARTPAEATPKHPWIKPHWDVIPPETEILLTHGPPMNILDEVTRLNGDSHDPPQHVGCEELVKKLSETQVKLHVFGHIHEARGWMSDRERLYVNASSLNQRYKPADKKPIRVIREVHQDGTVRYAVQP